VAVVALGSCSDDDDPEAGGGTTATTTGIVSDLIETGEQVCTDVADDVTTSATAESPPPVPQPGADILSVTSTLDDEEFTTTFELAGEPDISGDYLISVGLMNDYDGGFEVQIQADSAGVWGAELTIRTEGTGTPTPLRDAEVFVGDTSLELVIPREALRPIGRDQPLLYGTSTVVRDGGTFLDAEGAATTDPDRAARALDDCIALGQ
jgi:hypothetical protein